MAEIALRSEVAGTVWKIAKGVGARVERDEAVLVLESMKMEIPVEAPAAGTVKELLVQEGDAVREAQPVAVLVTD